MSAAGTNHWRGGRTSCSHPPAWPLVPTAAPVRPAVPFRELAPVIRPEPSALTAGVARVASELRSVDGGQPGSDMPRSLAGSGNQQGDRGRAEMQHQDQQELHDYGAPQQHTSRIYSDETRLTQGAARPGLGDPKAAAWTMKGRHPDSPTRGQVRRYAAVQGSSSDQRGEDYRGWPRRQRPELLAFDARLSGAPPTLLDALSGGDRRVTGPLWPRHQKPSVNGQ
jgi:hypothetical protein